MSDTVDDSADVDALLTTGKRPEEHDHWEPWETPIPESDDEALGAMLAWAKLEHWEASVALEDTDNVATAQYHNGHRAAMKEVVNHIASIYFDD